MTSTIAAPVPAADPNDAATLIDAYDRDGFVLIERLMSARDLADAQRGVEWAMTNQQGKYIWIKQRTYEWFREHPVFVRLIEHPTVIAFGRALLGDDDMHLIGAQCSRNTKADHYAPGVINIHQDTGLHPLAERKIPGLLDHHYAFSAMWYLQDTPLEMGPTELLVGSHRDGGRQHTNATIDADPSGSRLLRRAIPAGSLLIFSHYTWHRGADNATDTPRDLITNAYARRMIEKSHLTVAGEDGVQRYIPPADLLPEFSPTMRRLLE